MLSRTLAATVLLAAPLAQCAPVETVPTAGVLVVQRHDATESAPPRDLLVTALQRTLALTDDRGALELHSLGECLTYHGQLPAGRGDDKVSRVWYMQAHQETCLQAFESVQALSVSVDGQGDGDLRAFAMETAWQDDQDAVLAWIGDSVVEESVRQARVRSRLASLPDQVVLDSENFAPRTATIELGPGRGTLVFLKGPVALLEWTMSDSMALKEIVVVSKDSLPLPLARGNERGLYGGDSVPRKDVERLSTVLSKFPGKQLVSDLRYLSGEEQSTATTDDERWQSRHSMSRGGAKASAWLLRKSFLSLARSVVKNGALT
ncbi:hypothetical protein OIV83_004963 [Microbotryomycetes sp. JL201]|nr:hypothetical protein OIV83_004963 [Microbotryomycetes sp. JL201]